MPRTVSHNRIIQYFESLQQAHVQLNWFYRYNWNEISSALKYDGDGYILLMESHSANLSKGEPGASTRNNRTISFLVLKSCAVDDYNAQNDALDESEQIILDLVAKIQKDSQNLTHTSPLKWLKGFDTATVLYDAVPRPLFVSYYGYNAIIELPNPAEICYTAEVAARFGE